MPKLTLLTLLTLLLLPAFASAQDATDQPLYVGGPNGDELPGVKKKLRFYRGDAREPITAEQFFLEAGRDDLAAKLDKNKKAQRAEAIGFGLAGAAIGGGAVWLGLQSESCDGLGPVEEHDCESRNRQLVGGAITVGALGLRLLVVSLDAIFSSPIPVEPKAARSLAQSHNASLAPSARSTPRLRLDLGVKADGTVVLLGRF